MLSRLFAAIIALGLLGLEPAMAATAFELNPAYAQELRRAIVKR